MVVSAHEVAAGQQGARRGSLVGKVGLLGKMEGLGGDRGGLIPSSYRDVEHGREEEASHGPHPHVIITIGHGHRGTAQIDPMIDGSREERLPRHGHAGTDGVRVDRRGRVGNASGEVGRRDDRWARFDRQLASEDVAAVLVVGQR